MLKASEANSLSMQFISRIGITARDAMLQELKLLGVEEKVEEAARSGCRSLIFPFPKGLTKTMIQYLHCEMGYDLSFEEYAPSKDYVKVTMHW